MAKWHEKSFIKDATNYEPFTNDFNSSSFRQLKLTEFEEHLQVKLAKCLPYVLIVTFSFPKTFHIYLSRSK